MLKNYTNVFINLVDDVLFEEKAFFEELEQDKIMIEKKIFEHFKIFYNSNQNNMKELFKEYIKEFILMNKNNFTMSTSKLFDISKQIHIDYLLGDCKEERFNIYYSISKALQHYGIYSEDKICDLSNIVFWKKLIKKLYLLYFISKNSFLKIIDHNFIKENSTLVESLKYFKNNTSFKIDCIDGNIVFKKCQEMKIIKFIEKKLQQIDIFEFLSFILIQKRNDRRIPFNYIINLALKNIHLSNLKKSNDKIFKTIVTLFINFINLYQLRSFNMWEYMYIDEQNIEEKLKKQILHLNLYSLSYPLNTDTLIAYINNLIGNEILNKEFKNKFGFSMHELTTFLINTDKLSKNANIIKIDLKYFKELEKIVSFFSVDSKVINKNYLIPASLVNIENLFIHNPIIKHKNTYYLVGFKYFKMNFYNALVEKIRLNFDSKVTTKIGNNIDTYVEYIFSNKNFDIYSGKYKITKNNKLECDLVIKLDNKIIFIENKNKGLRKESYSGSSIHILQDFIRAFATSQFQLLRHEKNLLDKKQFIFDSGKILTYNNEQIIKISLSPNNWYSIMNNLPRNIIHALTNIRFTFKQNVPIEVEEEFTKTNKDLQKLTDIILELDKNYKIDNILFNSLFIPLELLSENENDKKAIEYIIGLLYLKNDITNIYDGYNNYKKLH